MYDDELDFGIGADDWDMCRLQSKEADREELAQLTAEFLARGGQITFLSTAATGLADGFLTKAMVASRNAHNTTVSARAKENEARLIAQARKNLARATPLPLESLALNLQCTVDRMRKLHQLYLADVPGAAELLALSGRKKMRAAHSAMLKERREGSAQQAPLS